MFKKGDIIVKIRGARVGHYALVTEDQKGSYVSINYGRLTDGVWTYTSNDPDYSPEDYLQLIEEELDFEVDV